MKLPDGIDFKTAAPQTLNIPEDSILVVRGEDGLGTCELCFTTATPKEIAAAEVPLEGADEEDALNADMERASGKGRTIVAFALLGA